MGGWGGESSFFQASVFVVGVVLVVVLVVGYETFRVGKSRESFYILFF